jgi:hypothetical protein
MSAASMESAARRRSRHSSQLTSETFGATPEMPVPLIGAATALAVTYRAR